MFYLIGCPGVGGSLNAIPNKIETFKPKISRRFIPNLTPDPLLGIQPGLITRQIPQTKSHMGSYKQINFLPLMPSRPVYIKPDGMPSESAIKILQTGNKSLSISPRSSDHPPPTRQGSYPSKQIQPFTMLTRGRNTQPLPSFCPSHTQTRIKRKPRFVLKDYGLLWTQELEFFLRPDEIAWPPHSSLGDRYIRPLQPIPQLVHPGLSLTDLQSYPKLTLQINHQCGTIPSNSA